MPNLDTGEPNMTAPITVDEFFTLVDRSGLLPPDRINAFIERLRSTEPNLTTSEAIARQMVRERLLTPFQARQLLRGRHRGFFLTEKYKILELLGEGGMGRVLLCEHLMLNKLVAVKLLQMNSAQQPGAVERFLREARAAAALDHPNIVRVFDVDKAGTTPFMVMDYIDGTNLHQLVAEHGPLTIERAADYIRQAALGLQHAFENGLIHRDIKPGNLLLDRNGVVKMLDLGLARFFDAGKNENLTQKFDEKSVLGTADFIAPEQAMNSSKVDIRADIYSLGCTMYYLLLRRFPFEDGSVAQKLMWHQTKEPIPVRELRPDVPAGLADVLERMMRKKPEDRYQTPAEVVQAVQPWVGQVPLPSPQEMPKVRPSAYQLGLSLPPSPSLLSGSQAETPSPLASDHATGINPVARRSAPVGYPTSRPNVPAGTGVTPALHPGMWPSGVAGPPPMTPNTGDYAAYPHSNLPPGTMPPVAHSGQFPPGMVPTDRFVMAQEAKSNKTMLIGFVTIGLLLLLVGAGLAVTMLGGFSGNKSTLGGITGNNKTPEVAATSPTLTRPTTPTTEPTTTVVRQIEYTLNGAGSSFVGPLMERWAERFVQLHGTEIKYKPIGSGGGIKGIIDDLQDFGCTDAPMKDSELQAARANRGEVIHIPLAMGAVVVTYNLPTVTTPLRFTGAQIADIYLGKIKNWNDPSIRANNPGVNLPDLPIIPIHRSDSSGTTDIFTDYLSKVSVAWEKGPGRGKTVKWPVDEMSKADHGAPQNNGVAEKVNRTEGAIGYVELGYALANSLPVAELKNREGVMVKPNLITVTAAANGIMQDLPEDLTFSLTDAPGKSAYPICGTVWAILYTNQEAAKGQRLVEFFRWATGAEGQEFCTELNYAPLPESMRPIIREKLKRVTGSMAARN